ncbi:hypothetical protein LDENG_00244470, partial [Lucifuga dentata]
MILVSQQERERRRRRSRRKEVGCQWESPKETREVGCQSETAERRDAAVQVDLLSQQLTWRQTGCQFVSIRADEPAGGALLQRCRLDLSAPQSSAQQLAPPTQEVVKKSEDIAPSATPICAENSAFPLYLFCTNQKPPILPSSPEDRLLRLLTESPAPPIQLQPQQMTLLPSMPLCDGSPSAGRRCAFSPPPADSSAPPPGLIAPLSPHLAEEEEEEEEKEE